MGIYYEDDNIVVTIYSPNEIQEIKLKTKQQSAKKAKQTYIKNSPKRREKTRKRVAIRLKEDPIFKMKHNIKNLIRNSIKAGGYSKNSKTFEILGCDIDTFKNHIESQFTEGMSWENYGEWEYDHMTPISWATDEETIIRLNHFSNFQPLWKEDNRDKSNKFSSLQKPLIFENK